MNWFWTIRGRDGGMNGLEFCRSLTAGDLRRVLVHAAPAKAAIEVRADDDTLIAKADLDRDGDYSPITLLDLTGEAPRRSEVWPTEEHIGMPVLLPGGEVGILTSWRHAPDHEWWQWSVEFSNHKGRPADWEPPDSKLRR